MSSSGAFLRPDSISTRDKMTGVDGTVNRKKAKYRKIIHHNLRSIIESRHVLCGILCTPQIEGYCDHLPPLSERYSTFLILRTVELLPIWIMFIDRIIDRIWIFVVVLTTELLNLAQIKPCFRGAWNATPFWQPKIRPRNGVYDVYALCIIR